MRGLSGQTLLFAAVAAAAVVVAAYFLWPGGAAGDGSAGASKLRLEDIPFPGEAAYDDLKQICDIGPRPSGSPGMVAQQKLLTEHFKKLGAQVRFQEFRARNSLDGSMVPMANLIVQWFPDRKERIAIFTHYDTRPFPDEDSKNPKGVFLGANDGASGVAILMELGRKMPELKTNYGVDFVFLDAEEFVFPASRRCSARPGDPLVPRRREYFARDYAAQPPPYRYKWGRAFLDMVGGTRLSLPEEFNSASWADTKPLVDDIWHVAGKLGVSEFHPKVDRKHPVEDDHLRLHDLGKIPTCDIIDFNIVDDFPYWHTTQDTPAHCSALSLAKVGWVLQKWLEQVK